MTKRFEKEITVSKTSGLVFSFVSSLENLTKLTDFVSVKLVSGTGETGSIYEATTKSFLGTKSRRLFVVKNTPPTLFAYKDKSQIYDNEIGFELEEVGEKTTVKGYIQFTTSTLTGMLTNNLEKAAITELDKIMSNLENALIELKIPKIAKVSPPLDVVTSNSDIAQFLGKTPEEIAVKFKKSNY